MDTRKLTNYQHRHAKPVHLAIGDKYEKVATMKTSDEWQDTHIAAELVKRWNTYAERDEVLRAVLDGIEEATSPQEARQAAEMAAVQIRKVLAQ